MNLSADIQPIVRNFIAKDFVITDWQSLEPYFIDLKNRTIDTQITLEKWLQDTSELEAVISEDACWRQIKMTCNTTDEKLVQSFTYFMAEIQPKVQALGDELNKKLISSPAITLLDKNDYFTYLRSIKKNIELFKEENLPLQSALGIEAQEFGTIAAKMTVTVQDQEYTLQQAAKFLHSSDRNLREEVYRKINERRLTDKETLNELYTKLIQKRHQIAVNAGFDNYIDYRFKELGRFDYTPDDCSQFHEAVKKYVLPIVEEIYEKKRQKLGVTTLKPWDIDAEIEGEMPLKPFQNSQELIHKSLDCLQKVHPFFADCIRQMNTMERLDLESRKGKAPGGYNCPLAETGAPFIFMNAAGTPDDVITMVHESGHAVHSFLAHHLPLTGFKEYPMEMAEVASMSMELFTMDYWNAFYASDDEMKKAKEHQLERVITIFPWIATIDKFQFWIYQNPNHTVEERIAAWNTILTEFTPKNLDISGLAHYRSYGWQKQLHLYEVPFYYIEYGIAQLGAIAMWQQFKNNKEQAIKNYIKALALGGTKTLPELYKIAGIPFDLSSEYIKELASFVKRQMEEMEGL